MVKERVLITGGAGYIGNVLIRKLLERGYKVSCLDNLLYSQGGSIFPLVEHPDFEFTFGDVEDKSTLSKLIKKSDIIIPLAAIVGAPACDRKPLEAKRINRDAVIWLNKMRSKNQKFIFVNTNSGYGVKDRKEYCTEEDELTPISIYGKTKCQAEESLLEGGKKSIVLRLATVFGVSPRMRRDLIVNDFVYKALIDRAIVLFEPHFRRNFVSIKDVVSALSYCIENYEIMEKGAYNLGNDQENMSKEQLAKKVQMIIPPFEIYISNEGKDPDKRDYVVSNEKLRKAGFTAKIPVDEGIVELKKAFEILLKHILHTNI